MLATERDDSALLPGMFRLAVSSPDEPQPAQLAIHGPFALIGREEGCACRLEHTDVSRRHAYLQAVFGRIFCVDLGSRTGTHWGETTRKSGWLDAAVPIGVGPYQVQVLDSIGLGSPSVPFPENFSPLDPYAGQMGTLPRVEVEILSGAVPSAEMTITRLITLVGSSPRCKLRLQHSSVAKVDCSLLWRTDGLWIVDLCGRGHSRLRGKVLRCARLENEQTLRLGRFHLRVHYSTGAVPTGSPDTRGSRHSQSTLKNPRALANDGAPEVVLATAEAGDQVPGFAENSLSETATVDSTNVADQHASPAAEFQNLEARRQAADERERALDARESKLREAQSRLASEWEQLHVDRAAYDALAADFARRQEDLATRLRRLAEDTESLGRQRIELANRTAELTDFKQRLTFEWQQLAAQQAAFPAADLETSGFGFVPNEPVTDPGYSFPMQFATPDAASSPGRAESADNVEVPADATPLEFDVLETVRHNKVFAADRQGPTLVVTPLGDASEFHYGDVHVESNKVRRLLEGGAFANLVVDLGNAPVYSAVTINVVVALSRIASNRGGRAVLCRASEKTRTLLQTMRLLDVWPLFDSREDAFEALAGPPA
jgi:anti-anti-sigma regulatory factor